jgi:phospholipid transport system substrate-binding protein
MMLLFPMSPLLRGCAAVVRAGLCALWLGMGMFGGIAIAQDASKAPPQNASPQNAQDKAVAARAFIQELGGEAIDMLVNKRSPNQTHAQSQFEALLLKGFDVPTIGRFVLGKYWREASADQQQEYLLLFQTLLVRVYANRFAEFDKVDFEITGSEPVGSSDINVNTKIKMAGREAAKIDWRVRDKSGGPRIVDVVVEGISMAVSQRSEFDAIIQRSGKGVNGLIEALRDKVKPS